MLFNSLGYLLFLPTVFILYWFVFNKSLKIQNLLLLVSSYFFYSCWDYRFLFLLIFSTILDYLSGIQIEKTINKTHRKLWLWLSVGCNLLFLGFFKYYNFFIESFIDLFTTFGLKISPWTLNIILPIGISFYTFHGLSYVIDIYRNKIKPTYNFIDYSVFVSFFPLLVAGPIERATHLLPQIQKKRTFNIDLANDGIRQMLWGFFKKIVVADNCAIFANDIFSNYEELNGSALFLGAICFSFQIYCDFSGYSDIALGTAKLFGIELLRNFAYPYFSRDIAEFWRRWHISLSSWFKDYLYIPLGGSRGSKTIKIRNTFIIFIVSGFWHGANWTFVFWGFLNAIYFLPLLLRDKNRNYLDIIGQNKQFPPLREILGLITTFLLTTIAWVFFRSPDILTAFKFVGNMLSFSLFSVPLRSAWLPLTFAMLAMSIEWANRQHPHALSNLQHNFPKVIRWSFYISVLYMILFWGAKQQEFIYFQF